MTLDGRGVDPPTLLQEIAEHTPDILWMFTADWEHMLFINDPYETIWGRPIEGLEADATDFLAGVHPEDRDRIRADMERLSAGTAIESEYRVNPGEDYGRRVWVQGEPIVEGGEVLRVTGFVRDITDRHREQERIERRERVLREIYEVTADSARTLDEQIEALLEIGTATLGTKFGTLSEIRGEDYHFEVVATPDDTIAAGDVAPLSATNCERTAAIEETLVLANVAEDAPELTGKAGYTEWGIACYLGAPVILDDDVYGTFCFYDDEPRDREFTEWEVTLVDLMSQWVSTAMTRRETRRKLERQRDQLDDFASIVSHDLRNPLQIFSGSLELAAENGSAADFERCRGAVDRMEALIDDLLALSRAGERIDETEPVDLAALVETTWGHVATADATLDVDVERGVVADPTRLKQLFENLFRNAVEHGGEDVGVVVGDMDDGFFVADDGPGIPADRTETVFEAGHSTAESGTGFGLNIVRNVAQAHGWSVSAVDGEAGGARFEFAGVERTPVD